MCVRAQSCLTLCDPVDCSPPGSSVLGISQSGTLDWAAISFSRDRTHIFCVSCIGRRVLYRCTTWEDPLFTCVAGYFFLCVCVCACTCECVHLQGVWQHPWLSLMRHEQHPPNSWVNQTELPNVPRARDPPQLRTTALPASPFRLL